MESAERGYREDALTLKKLADLTLSSQGGTGGLIARLRKVPRYAPIMQALDSYGDRLILAKASGDHTGLDQVRTWVQDEVAAGATRLLVVVDYLQKIPVRLNTLEPETEVTTYLTQGLKEMAMALGVQVLAIAASDRIGLKSKRMRLADLRGQLRAPVRGRYRLDHE